MRRAIGDPIPTCKSCGQGLTDDNWYPSRKAIYSYLCKDCSNNLADKWKKEHPEKVRPYMQRYMKQYQPLYLSDPERRRLHNERAREGMRRYYSDPKKRARALERAREYYRRKRAERMNEEAKQKVSG